jgi:hypothetical protein
MRTAHVITALLVGSLSATGCGDDKKDSTAGPTAQPVSTSATATSTTTGSITTSEVGGSTFQDSFDDDRNKWGVVDDSEFGTIAYQGGDYVWVFRGSVAHWIPEVLGKQFDQGTIEMRNVVVKADATVDAGGGVVGVFCRETPDTDADFQWYEFVARDGFAAIRRSDAEANLDVLAETDAVSLPVGQKISFEASCVDDADGNAQLSLSLNGTPVLQATDNDPLGNGVSGLQAWTFPIHEEMDIRWHDFSIEPPTS